MQPEPVCVRDGQLWGGAPPSVAVWVSSDEIVITQLTIQWHGPHEPVRKPRPFATRPLRTPASEVAKLINWAYGKRLAEHLWCPKCHGSFEPEQTIQGLCHGCAERELGVVF